ncbi:uncharacterized protein LOC131245837 isoform X2 [Magnolia sinica]|uniref:uncharacterized protein LOC131245837 isoform X2 n=1 Tax=Magnolia sinica TaxID=86752 RepID=UPI00265AE893|nr:uncharacterized protein LOC131245837 isoform X2 [Magnolia sinica]
MGKSKCKHHRKGVSCSQLFFRCSTVTEATHESFPEVDFLTFIESTLDEVEGPHHRWLNRTVESQGSFSRDGIFLVVVGGFLEDPIMFGCDRIIMFERVKLLQQRYPSLHVFGFQSSSSVSCVAAQTRVIQTVMKEYITFPILFSNKDFIEMKNGACCLLFKGFRSPLLYHKKDLDLGMIIKVIEEFNVLQNANVVMVHNLKSTGVGKSTGVEPDVIKDLHIYSFRNLLLYFPGCISADEDGGRLFLSDTNHHRIIITDCKGKMLDCIGSSPGSEDGEFESAKLLRPAASFYHADEDCLYFVDSENHAIKRANMETRVLETVYPLRSSDKRVGSLWTWILDKLGMGREADPLPMEFDGDSVAFPWHLMKSEGNDLFIINRSFETLWIMDAATGEIKEVLKGFPKIMEICGQMIMRKVSLLKEILGDWLQQNVDPSYSLGLSYAGLMSSFATIQSDIVFCDTAGQRVLKFHKGSRDVSSLQFSNFGILGLPYWLAYPLERVSVREDLYGRPRNDHLQYFDVLPGRCDIRVNIDIPEGTELAAPLQEGCIWCQARGSAVEVSGSESGAASSDKVGVAQQWYDELDNLAFSKPEVVSNFQDEEETADRSSEEDNMVHINCAVNISPGTSEVVVNAVLYLKLNDMHGSHRDQEDMRTAEMVLDISNHDRSLKWGGDACAQLLLESHHDLRDLVFAKPLHLRIRFECGDHPTSDNSTKEIVFTDSSIVVNVTLT